MGDRSNGHRSKGVVLGAVTAVGAIIVGGAISIARADVSSGDRAMFVPIVPCRLFDTRIDNNVGPRNTPVGPGETFSQPVHGTNGLCTIPTDATAVALNVTIVNPTVGSYLTIWPSDAPRPLASNLNWQAGDPPTPNKVDVKLSADGRISIFNNAGTVDVLADAVGYYSNHNHDDRYYTKPQVDAALAGKANVPVGTTTLLIDSAAFRGDQGNGGFAHDFFGGYVYDFSGFSCAAANLIVPNGATITQISARVRDNNSSASVSLSLYRNPQGATPTSLMGSASTDFAGTPSDTTVTANAIFTPVVDSVNNGYFLAVCGLTPSTRLYDASVAYTNP